MNIPSTAFRLGLVVCATLVVGLGSSTQGFAANTCPPNPCFDNKDTFSRATCQRIADWVVIGSVTSVAPLPSGAKESAQVTLRVSQWEKSAKSVSVATTLQFIAGPCDNVQDLKNVKNGVYRFYGKRSPAPSNAFVYFYYERIDLN
ncbi:MAG TPA: hypothetical protein VK629_15740 [Steroidobacteraceae bacterium]|nr:hypothetical protein [Steroidobacteraceae bacterium]